MTVTVMSAAMHVLGAGAFLAWFLFLSWPGRPGLFGVTNASWNRHECWLVVCLALIIVAATAQVVLASLVSPAAFAVAGVLICLDLALVAVHGRAIVLVGLATQGFVLAEVGRSTGIW